jgi:hypothetical protein
VKAGIGKPGARWLVSVILATQEAEIRRITVRSQPGKIACETLSQKNPSQKRVGSRCRPRVQALVLQKKKKKTGVGDLGFIKLFALF